MPSKVQINAPAWNKVLNDKFLSIPYCKDNHCILYGSRSSSKSYCVAEVLHDRALKWPAFKCLVIRAEYNKHEDSTYSLLKGTIERNKTTSLFTTKTSPLKIYCKNGAEFIFRGMDDIEKIKGLEGINCIWFEEELPPTEDQFSTITLTARANNIPFIQYIYSINPTIPDHENHWFWKRWFENETELSFKKVISMTTEEGEYIEETATILHSCYLDNRWLNKQKKNELDLLKLKDPYTYATQALGRWSAKVPGGRFWKLFDLTKNSVRHNEYNPDLGIQLSFDFNKNPGIHCGIYQIDGYTIRQIDEISLRSPHNRTEDACKTFIRRYPNHSAGLFITGDPNGYRESSATEEGFNDFSQIFELLSQYKPQDRTIRKAPPVAKTGEWINEIFFNKDQGLEIIIPEDCNETISDMIYTQEMPDGTVFKPKVKPDKNESAYEKYGHFSDLLRYMMYSFFKREFESYANPGTGGISYGDFNYKEEW